MSIDEGITRSVKSVDNNQRALAGIFIAGEIVTCCDFNVNSPEQGAASDR